MTENRFIKLLFYGNYFYGFCTVALVAETSMLFTLNINWILYVLIFLSTVLFYNYPYARKNTNPSENLRTKWIVENKKLLIVNQVICTTLIASILLWILANHGSKLENINPIQWLLLLIFPIVGSMYYGVNFLTKNYNLRQIAWAKPFIIGFVWAGVANVYPFLYAKIINQQHFNLSILQLLQFLKTTMFTAMLAILFDIKDYADDNRSNLKTLVVRLGLRKTLFYVIVPLTILGVITFLSYAYFHDYSLLKILITIIPFALLIIVTFSFHKHRSLLYYLLVIDGLFLVKALFGILTTFL